jgi:hypothetical protein
MLSCIYHWSDEVFRKTLLLIGIVEGSFNKPYAGDDIRNFIVVAIRNSEIESVQSSNFTVAGLHKEIGDADIKMITSTAIEYLKKAEFTELQSQTEPPTNDIYFDLSRKYPVVWKALTGLANTTEQIVEYEKAFYLVIPFISALPNEWSSVEIIEQKMELKLL